MAGALAFLYGSGATLVSTTLLLPHSDNTRELGVAFPCFLAVFVVAALLKLGGRTSIGVLQAVLAAGSVLITECVLYGGDSAAAYALMYVWVALYASFFFSERAAVAQLGFAAVLYALVLTVQDETPVEHVYWLMGMGTVVVGAILIARLTMAIRAQAADLAAVAQMAARLPAGGEFARASCEGLHRSTRADAVVMLEPLEDGGGMRVSAMSGASEAGLEFNGEDARAAIQQAFDTGQPQRIVAREPRRGMRRFDGSVRGLAQPILRDGACAGVLALVWTSPHRTLPDRVTNAAVLFAAEASLALDRAERRRQDRARAALEINDTIVQGLVVAKYLAVAGETEKTVEAIDETLAKARKLMTDQLEDFGRSGPIAPGDLARREPSKLGEG
jgi:signal transduction histidine kinase